MATEEVVQLVVTSFDVNLKMDDANFRQNDMKDEVKDTGTDDHREEKPSKTVPPGNKILENKMSTINIRGGDLKKGGGESKTGTIDKGVITIPAKKDDPKHRVQPKKDKTKHHYGDYGHHQQPSSHLYADHGHPHRRHHLEIPGLHRRASVYPHDDHDRRTSLYVNAHPHGDHDRRTSVHVNAHPHGDHDRRASYYLNAHPHDRRASVYVHGNHHGDPHGDHDRRASVYVHGNHHGDPHGYHDRRTSVHVHEHPHDDHDQRVSVYVQAHPHGDHHGLEQGQHHASHPSDHYGTHHGSSDHTHHHGEHGHHAHHYGDHGHHAHHHGDHSHHAHHHGEHGYHPHNNAQPHSGRSRIRKTRNFFKAYSTFSGHDCCSTCNSSLDDPGVSYENTFKLDPEYEFKSCAVRKVILDVLNENLKDKEYDPLEMKRESKELSNTIKDKVKALKMRRFKIVALVLIGERKDQSVQISSRCLWDQRCDNFATATVSNLHIYATGMVFGTYFE